jgi:DNA mismatch repair protein MLH1
MFYQLGLRQFGAFSRIQLNPPVNLKELIQIGIESEEDAEAKSGKPKEELIQVGV